MTIVMSKSDLLEKLNKVLERAKREDERTATKHRADEQAALEKFRKKLRDALHWDWKTAKNKRYDYISVDAPSCPTLEAPSIERVIRDLKLDKRKNDQWNIPPGSDIYTALTWVHQSERAKKTVCD